MRNLQLLNKMRELFAKGYTPTQVADEVKINQKNIHYYINKYNIKVINKCRTHFINDEYFDSINTEEKAYLLGFFIADGNLALKGSRFAITVVEQDKNILEAYRENIIPGFEIHTKNKSTLSIKRQNQCLVRWGSLHMYNTFVNKYNIIPNKTNYTDFKFPFEKIPQDLVSHFIRGFFDGDGSVSYFNRSSTRKNLFFNFSFVMNSLEFTNQIGDIFEELFDIKKVIYTHKGKTCDYYTLRFDYSNHRQEAIKYIYNWLYKDSTLYLQRKKDKFSNYINTELRSKITEGLDTV
jgi:intein/homing endonuclease